MVTQDIIAQIATRDQDRVRAYQEFLDFYQGKQWPGRERWGEKRLTFNYSKVFIDKLVSYLMSGVNYTVESISSDAKDRAFAETAEKSLAVIYEANGLEQLDFETEIDCAILGDGCYKVSWDTEEKRVRVTAPDVRGIYVWWMGDDTSNVWRVASTYHLSEEEVEMMYGGSYKLQASSFQSSQPHTLETGNPQTANLTEIWTAAEFQLWLNGTMIEKKANPYGLIPFVIFPNLREPKQFWGTSDLIQILEPQRELNRAFSQVSRILELSGNPVAVLENVEESTDIAVKPGAVWNIPENAKAYLLDLLKGGGLDLHIKYIELLYRALHDISEEPREAFGDMDRNLSGTAMQIELYPLTQRVLRKQAIRTTAYRRRMWMMLKLLMKFGGKEKFDNDNFRPQVNWGQILPQDKVQLILNEQTLVNTEVHSRRTAMAEVGVRDPEGEWKQILEEKKIILGVENAKAKAQQPV